MHDMGNGRTGFASWEMGILTNLMGLEDGNQGVPIKVGHGAASSTKHTHGRTYTKFIFSSLFPLWFFSLFLSASSAGLGIPTAMAFYG
jgi:hypothetical protein